MKKTHIIKFLLFLSMGVISTTSIQAYADQDYCEVIGVHQPNSNIYDGPTWCRNATLSDITVRGPLQLKKTSIKGKADVSGPLKSESSNMGSIVLENQFTPVKINLIKGSIVKKNIEFKGLAGIVYKDQSSKIIGKVINGKIVIVK